MATRQEDVDFVALIFPYPRIVAFFAILAFLLTSCYVGLGVYAMRVEQARRANPGSAAAATAPSNCTGCEGGVSANKAKGE